jgi:hypothetical protein
VYPFSFYAAFLAVFLSVIGNGYLVLRTYDARRQRPLCKLAIESNKALNYFRTVLWSCGILFAITLFYFIVPRIEHRSYVLLAWVVTFICEMAMGVFSARGTIELRIHNFFSSIMAVGMFALALVFAVSLHGTFAKTEVSVAVVMFILGILALVHYQRYLFYELPYVFLSHVTILVAAVALR